MKNLKIYVTLTFLLAAAYAWYSLTKSHDYIISNNVNSKETSEHKIIESIQAQEIRIENPKSITNAETSVSINEIEQVTVAVLENENIREVNSEDSEFNNQGKQANTFKPTPIIKKKITENSKKILPIQLSTKQKSIIKTAPPSQPPEKPIIKNLEKIKEENIVSTTNNRNHGLHETKAEKKIDFVPHSSLRLAPDFSYSRLDGKDRVNGGEALVFSNLNLGFMLDWFFYWNKKWTSFVNGKVKNNKMVNSNSRKTITGLNQTQTQIGLGLQYHFSPKLALGTEISHGNELFYQGESINVIKLESIYLTRFNFYLNYTLISLGSLSLGGESKAGLILPSRSGDIKSEDGQLFEQKFFMQQALSDKYQIGVNVFYQRLVYLSNIADQNRTNLGAQVYLNYQLGE